MQAGIEDLLAVHWQACHSDVIAIICMWHMHVQLTILPSMVLLPGKWSYMSPTCPEVHNPINWTHLATAHPCPDFIRSDYSDSLMVWCNLGSGQLLRCSQPHVRQRLGIMVDGSRSSESAQAKRQPAMQTMTRCSWPLEHSFQCMCMDEFPSIQFPTIFR